MLRFRAFASLTIVLSLICCGCPTPPGGDPAVPQSDTLMGTGEILTISEDADGETVISLKWTADFGYEREEPVENLKLSTFKDLPADFEPKVGDKLALAVHIEYVRKLSVGPPDTWAVDQREITYLPDGLPK